MATSSGSLPANTSSPIAALTPLSLGGWGWRRGSGALASPPPSTPSYATDDDIVFEDFARLRLKGMKDEDGEDQFC